MREQIRITVDGRNIKTSPNVMLLDILNDRGIDVPRLCSHPSLTPGGACRLCMVEITKNEWAGQSKLVASCLYPAEDGLVVSTRSSDVLETRRALLELYLAQFPASETIRELAENEGIETTEFPAGDPANTCVLCGLCTRVCHEHGPGAIAALGRGTDKRVAPNPAGIAGDCTGCGACAHICPTGAIALQRRDRILTIWNRSFSAAVCSVRSGLCMGCGVCEEVCPGAVPRVSLSVNGDKTSVISPTACSGCGICAGSCPAGAIEQVQTETLDDCVRTLRAGSLEGKTVVFTCPRSTVPAGNEDVVIRVSCAGSVDLSSMLYCIAAGASGAALFCRDRLSCPHGKGGDLAKKRAAVAGELLNLCGFQKERIAFLRPCPGPDGPARALREFKDRLKRYPADLQSVYVPAEGSAGLNLALDIVRWLKEQPEMKPLITSPVESLFGTGRLPELQLVLSLFMDEPEITDITGQTGFDAHTFENPEVFLHSALMRRRGAWQESLPERPSIPTGTPPAPDCRRIESHPILPAPGHSGLTFTFDSALIPARAGEMISAALYAAGITVFGHHHRDGAAQGIFCANGQCSQCMVVADGKPVKACMTPVTAGMEVRSLEGMPVLADDSPAALPPAYPEETGVDVLVIGGGPAGICAAAELGRAGIDVLVVDDRHEAGGKLGLQTHNFFGSVSGCYAGYRGTEIGRILAGDLARAPGVSTWLNATVTGVFSDGRFGVSMNGSYRLVKPRRVLFATGARENSLSIPGADLPGVYGAGAFQTMVNRDLVRCAERLFIIGGGNVGLIGAYHALQAGIDVVGLVEAMPRCGGYKVHEDKIRRLGVPVWTAHTVLRIEGRRKVERVVIAAVDERLVPVPGTGRSFHVDTVLMAVGLSPVDEMLQKAREYGIAAYAAGDAAEIAEASAAIFSGKIAGRRIAQDAGIDLPVPGSWESFGELLKHRPGEAATFRPPGTAGPAYPLIRCIQEIPCNPCTGACPQGCISMSGSILSLPEFNGECTGCGRCVLACPGLAITVVFEQYDPDGKKALLMLPFEFNNEFIPLGREVITTGMEGGVVGRGRGIAFKDRDAQDSRRLLLLEVPFDERLRVAGFRMLEPEEGGPLPEPLPVGEDPIVCRCERVRKSEIVRQIRDGVRDMNQLKAVTRAGLGACGGKSCTRLILQIYREEGVPLSEVTIPTHRPLVSEVHLGDFIAGATRENRR